MELNAAKICGINTNRTLIWVYILGGALSGLAGALLASRTYAGNPSYGLAWELDAIAAAVIGGVFFKWWFWYYSNVCDWGFNYRYHQLKA